MNHPILLDSVGEHMPGLSDPNDLALNIEEEVLTTKEESVDSNIDCAGYEAWQELRGNEIRICKNDKCADERYEGYMYHPTGPPSIGGDVNLATFGCDSKTIYFMEQIPPTLAHLSTDTRNTLLGCLEFRKKYWIAARAISEDGMFLDPAIEDPNSRGGYVVCGPSHQEKSCDRAKENRRIKFHFENSGKTLKLCGNNYAVMYEKTDDTDIDSTRNSARTIRVPLANCVARGGTPLPLQRCQRRQSGQDQMELLYDPESCRAVGGMWHPGSLECMPWDEDQQKDVYAQPDPESCRQQGGMWHMGRLTCMPWDEDQQNNVEAQPDPESCRAAKGVWAPYSHLGRHEKVLCRLQPNAS